MKSFIYILLTSLTFLVVGCQNESEEIRLINQAERLFDAYPDSVITTLDSIPLPEEMSPRLIARWCMLYARAADKIEDEMPYTNQLEIALKYYQKKKMREEEAEIGLYLGRSYVEDKEYEKAMRAYSDALEVALAIKNYNRAGYICSYMGDLYELDDRYVLAAKKYKESGRYFRLAGNMKSYVRSFVNEGRSYMDVDSNYLALTILKRAEVIIDSLRVDEVRNYVYNGLGNIFNVLEKYVREGMEIIDVGTGSGILAVQAALLGADKVLALDFDPVAVKAAGENVALNHLADKVTVRNSDLLKAADMKGDIVIANIVADIILRLLPDVPNYLKGEKIFISSGIIDTRRDEVLAMYEKLGFEVLEVREDKGWVAIVGKYQEQV